MKGQVVNVQGFVAPGVSVANTRSAPVAWVGWPALSFGLGVALFMLKLG